MNVQLDHLIIPARNKAAAADCLSRILGVPWAPARVGPFAAVFVNPGLTIDFDECPGEFAKGHYCFRVTEDEFQAILGRLDRAGIAYRSLPHGEDDHAVNRSVGGSIVYWREPDGHVWELLTESYARGDTADGAREVHRRDQGPAFIAGAPRPDAAGGGSGRGVARPG